MSSKKTKTQRAHAAQRRDYLAAQRAPKQYWHGGAPGRAVGDELLSRDDAARLLTTPTTHGLQAGYALGVTRPDRVYFTSDRNFARAYASRHQVVDQTTGIVYERGSLYRVEPIGAVEEDQDFSGTGVSWSAPKARIVAVEATDVHLDLTAATQHVGPYMTWDDGTPIYAPDGSYQPSPILRRAGKTANDFKGRYPAWFPFDLVDADLRRRPGHDRPDASVCEGIGLQAASTAEVYRTHMSRSADLIRQRGVTVRPYERGDVATINAMLAAAQHHTRIQDSEEEVRGVALAVHPQDGIIGAAIITAMTLGDRPVVWVDAVVTTDPWRHRGVASMLLNTAPQLVPGKVEFTAGHCPPDVAPFFAQAGFTVLRPGVDLVVPVVGDPKVFTRTDGEPWFYRQSAL
ncbi:hypothetical protein [Curtobacterium sp. MCLR17_054]|uniref:hypothetical protein n=1 Tax=Curtobacterium sp. MCLR17_054 TaxID=2175632 RepID=UPI000DA7B351|nr:hypothetical protein [Curtobacterium sp. MCLR17_054]WIE70366.1 hypothetical protein DEJ08_018800 [Curtobacterium sp. MCLR17_054]